MLNKLFGQISHVRPFSPSHLLTFHCIPVLLTLLARFASPIPIPHALFSVLRRARSPPKVHPATMLFSACFLVIIAFLKRWKRTHHSYSLVVVVLASLVAPLLKAAGNDFGIYITGSFCSAVVARVSSTAVWLLLEIAVWLCLKRTCSCFLCELIVTVVVTFDWCRQSVGWSSAARSRLLQK